MNIYSVTPDTDLSLRLVGIPGPGTCLSIESFSDGEHLPVFKNSIRGQDVHILCNENSDSAIMKTMLSIDAAKRSGAKTISLIWPCLPYSRQDKVDHLRSSIGAKLFADMLQVAGIDKLYTLDLHASSIMGFYDIEVVHVKAAKIFAQHVLGTLDTTNMTVVSPDQGGVKRATDFAKLLPGVEFAMINKKRLKPNEVATMDLVGTVDGRDVILVDDMCDTGGTLCKAAQLLKDSGAKSVRAICTHGIFSGKAFKNIDESVLTEIYVSDSLSFSGDRPDRIRVISCADLLASVLNKVLYNESVESVYNK